MKIVLVVIAVLNKELVKERFEIHDAFLLLLDDLKEVGRWFPALSSLPHYRPVVFRA